jgi:hypothetical protein
MGHEAYAPALGFLELGQRGVVTPVGLTEGNAIVDTLFSPSVPFMSTRGPGMQIPES